MDPIQVRRLIIKALFSDDVLLEQLVLKGGNALNLVHDIGKRSSLDIDLSLNGDFLDVGDAENRIFGALERRLETEGLLLFDKWFEEIGQAAEGDGHHRWGGYQITFKVISHAQFEKVSKDFNKARVQSLVIGPSQERTFTVQISRFEYCGDKTEATLDEYTIYVYSPAMIAFEKLRAICQQMPDYPARRRKTARAKDFYDIHAITIAKTIDFAAETSQALVRNIFMAKDVPLKLIPQIRDHREFHRPDWPQVENSVTGELKSFDFYFDFVLEQAELLKPLWVKDTPR